MSIKVKEGKEFLFHKSKNFSHQSSREFNIRVLEYQSMMRWYDSKGNGMIVYGWMDDCSNVHIWMNSELSTERFVDDRTKRPFKCKCKFCVLVELKVNVKSVFKQISLKIIITF